MTEESDEEDKLLCTSSATGMLRRNKTKSNFIGSNQGFYTLSNTMHTEASIISPRPASVNANGKNKRDDHRKRSNFFYQTLNGSNVSYTPSRNSNHNLHNG